MLKQNFLTTVLALSAFAAGAQTSTAVPTPKDKVKPQTQVKADKNPKKPFSKEPDGTGGDPKGPDGNPKGPDGNPKGPDGNPPPKGPDGKLPAASKITVDKGSKAKSPQVVGAAKK